MRKTFTAQKKAAVKIAGDLLGKVAKATNSDPFKGIINQAALEKLRGNLEKELEAMAQDGASEGLNQVAYLISDEGSLDAMLSQANDRATEWAADHAAELVTQINDTTMEGLSTRVQMAIDKGWTNAQLSDAIAEYTGFDDARADLIATTETAFADVAGNLEGWKASGVVEGKTWIEGTQNVCEICEGLDNVTVDLDGTFDYDGEAIDGPPGHPRCACDLVPKTMTQEQIDAATAEE